MCGYAEHHRACVCRYDSQIPHRFCSQVLHARSMSRGVLCMSLLQPVLHSLRCFGGPPESRWARRQVQPGTGKCPSTTVNFPHFPSIVSHSRVPIQRDNVYHAVAFSVGDKGSDAASRLVQCFLMCRNQRCLLQHHTWSCNNRNASMLQLFSFMAQTCRASARRVS